MRSPSKDLDMPATSAIIQAVSMSTVTSNLVARATGTCHETDEEEERWRGREKAEPYPRPSGSQQNSYFLTCICV